MKFALPQSGLTILLRFLGNALTIATIIFILLVLIGQIVRDRTAELATDHRGQQVQFDLPLERYEN